MSFDVYELINIWKSVYLERKIEDIDDLSIFSDRNSLVASYYAIQTYLKNSHNIYISEMFELGRIQIKEGAWSPVLCLYTITKEKPSSIRIGQYRWKTTFEKIKHLSHNTDFEFYPQFREYISAIRRWVFQGDKPEDCNEYLFNEIPYGMFNQSFPFASRYMEAALNSQKAIEKQNTVPLSEIAYLYVDDTHEPPVFVELTKKEKERKIYQNFRAFDGIYSLAELHTRNRFISDFPLEKGDILVHTADNVDIYVGFIDEEPDEPLCCRQGGLIIRSKGEISPYYLYIYLRSESGINLLSSYLFPDSRLRSVDNLSQLPIILPNLEDSLYEDFFDSFYRKGKRVSAFEPLITRLSNEKTTNVINNELLQKIQNVKTEEIKLVMKQDLLEVQKCLSIGAYKAAVIMSGAILEMFLYDWWGELKGVDYYSINKEEYKRNHPGFIIPESLNDLINAIKIIKKPKWLKEAKHAHMIRKARNQVHAQLCIQSKIDLDEEKCKEILEYLEEIINTRYQIK